MATNNLLGVPRRSELIARFESANRWAIGFLCLQLLLIVGLAFLIDWKGVHQEPLITTIAMAAVVGPFVMSILTLVVTKKKEIGDLQEQTRFGQFDKHRLRTLFDDTLRRLNLPRRRLPVYIVADKFTNASMMHVGLGFLFRSINGVYLNRQALHKFNAEEVQDVMGHELGHYYRYYLIADRFRLVTLTLGALAGILVVQLIGLGHFGGMIAVMLCTFGMGKLISIPHAMHAWTIEYLCDDLGAQVHGVAVSVSGLMKLGAEAELMAWVQQQAILSKHGSQLSAHEVVAAIEKAIPYGHASREEIESAVQKSIKNRAQQGATVSGFLRYMWQSDIDAAADNEVEEEMRKLQALQAIPRLPWESHLQRSGDFRFDECTLERLVQMIGQYPDHALFRTPDAIGEVELTHPPLKQRIMYLWNNRREIESAGGT